MEYESAVGKVLGFKVADVDDGPATPLFDFYLRRIVGSLVDGDVHFRYAIVLVLGNHVYFVIVSFYTVTQSISRLIHVDEGVGIHGDLLRTRWGRDVHLVGALHVAPLRFAVKPHHGLGCSCMKLVALDGNIGMVALNHLVIVHSK